MPMLVVQVWRVRMCVLESAMLVGVGMRFPWRVFRTVLMPMMLVVRV